MPTFKLLLEKTNEVAEFLRSKGYKRTQVSVRYDYISYRVTIKDITIPIDEIKKLVNQFESISYDEYTHEILSGGNTFVFVEYDEDLIERIEDEYKDKATEIIRNCLINMGKYIDIGNGIKICYPGDTYHVDLDNIDIDKDGHSWGERPLSCRYIYKYKGKEYTRTQANDDLRIFLAQHGIKP